MAIHVQQIVTVYACDWCASVLQHDDDRTSGAQPIPQVLHLWRRVRVSSLAPSGEAEHESIICPSCALRCTTAISGQRELARREAQVVAGFRKA